MAIARTKLGAVAAELMDDLASHCSPPVACRPAVNGL